jgi:hypothetical protein
VPTQDRDPELTQLREKPENLHLAGGYGPLLVGAVLFVLIVLLAPTIAPEQVVERPVGGTTTTVVVTTTTTAAGSTTAPTAAP